LGVEKVYLLFSFLLPFDFGDIPGDGGRFPVLIIHSGSADTLLLFFVKVICKGEALSLESFCVLFVDACLLLIELLGMMPYLILGSKVTERAVPGAGLFVDY